MPCSFHFWEVNAYVVNSKRTNKNWHAQVSLFIFNGAFICFHYFNIFHTLVYCQPGIFLRVYSLPLLDGLLLTFLLPGFFSSFVIRANVLHNQFSFFFLVLCLDRSSILHWIALMLHSVQYHMCVGVSVIVVFICMYTAPFCIQQFFTVSCTIYVFCFFLVVACFIVCCTNVWTWRVVIKSEIRLSVIQLISENMATSI